MKKIWKFTLLGALLCILVALPLVTNCVPSAAPSREKGVLNLWDSGPMTLDPAISSEMTSHTYVMQIFRGLVRLGDNSMPAPDIAESWQRSDDGKTYTFYLRRGEKFHDGNEATG